jgi:folate-dependent phosphoribosylglycinamide formyltransferase PurN
VPALDVAVLTSAAEGVELAAALARLTEVRSVTVVTTGVLSRRLGPLDKLRRLHRDDGMPGLFRAAVGRLLRPWKAGRRAELAALVSRACPGATHFHCDDLHSPSSIARLRELAPDLGVVFATYPLRAEVFTIPRLGCLNLHLGRAPEFRGSSPGFYELMEGVPEVGVTIHRVIEGLDSGPILLQEVFPLDIAPSKDPISYLRQYQTQILMPNGIRLMARAVERMARGTVEEHSQPAGRRPRRRASHRLKQELRRRVAARR